MTTTPTTCCKKCEHYEYGDPHCCDRDCVCHSDSGIFSVQFTGGRFKAQDHSTEENLSQEKNAAEPTKEDYLLATQGPFVSKDTGDTKYVFGVRKPLTLYAQECMEDGAQKERARIIELIEGMRKEIPERFEGATHEQKVTRYKDMGFNQAVEALLSAIQK